MLSFLLLFQRQHLQNMSQPRTDGSPTHSSIARSSTCHPAIKMPFPSSNPVDPHGSSAADARLQWQQVRAQTGHCPGEMKFARLLAGEVPLVLTLSVQISCLDMLRNPSGGANLIFRLIYNARINFEKRHQPFKDCKASINPRVRWISNREIPLWQCLLNCQVRWIILRSCNHQVRKFLVQVVQMRGMQPASL